MTLHISDLRPKAEEKLQNANYDPKKLVLIHTAISLGVSFLSVLISFVMSRISLGGSGLSGLGPQAVLETAQLTLELAVVILLPFWNIALIRAVLNWIKEEPATPHTLLEGFRRFGSVLGVKLMQGAIYLALGIAAMNIGSIVFLLTPFSAPLTAALEPIVAEAGANATAEMLMTEEVIAQLGVAVVPMLIICFVLFAAVAIPVFYRTRFADYAVMDGDGAVLALLGSFHFTRKRIWQIMKIDLSFWWFYLLEFLCLTLCYGDSLLALAGVQLPIREDLSYFLFYLLGIVCQGILLWQYQAKISTTYGLAYTALREDAMAAITPPAEEI